MAVVKFVHDGAQVFDVSRFTRHETVWVDISESHEVGEGTVGVSEALVEGVASGLAETELDSAAIGMTFTSVTAEDSIPAVFRSTETFEKPNFGVVRISASRHRWTLSVHPGQLRDRAGSSAGPVPHGLSWEFESPVGQPLQSPAGLLQALGDWLNQTFHRPPSSVDRLISASEELVRHLRKALDERDELRRRLAKALGGQQHAEDRIRVLASQVASLELQLLEANAAVASGDRQVIDQSKTSLMAMATIVVSLLALASSVAGPFLSDWLANDDTQALVDAQRETTAAIEAVDDPNPIDLSIEVALRCVVDGTYND